MTIEFGAWKEETQAALDRVTTRCQIAREYPDVADWKAFQDLAPATAAMFILVARRGRISAMGLLT